MLTRIHTNVQMGLCCWHSLPLISHLMDACRFCFGIHVLSHFLHSERAWWPVGGTRTLCIVYKLLVSERMNDFIDVMPNDGVCITRWWSLYMYMVSEDVIGPLDCCWWLLNLSC